MFESLRWWLSTKKNANFWDWVRDTYSDDELRKLTTEATHCSLIRPYVPFGDSSSEANDCGEEITRKTIRRLIKRYGNEIWSCCLGAGSYDPDTGRIGIKCLAGLDLAFQVYNSSTLEEFLVRNALKQASTQLLGEDHGNV